MHAPWGSMHCRASQTSHKIGVENGKSENTVGGHLNVGCGHCVHRPAALAAHAAAARLSPTPGRYHTGLPVPLAVWNVHGSFRSCAHLIALALATKTISRMELAGERTKLPRWNVWIQTRCGSAAGFRSSLAGTLEALIEQAEASPHHGILMALACNRWLIG